MRKLLEGDGITDKLHQPGIEDLRRAPAHKIKDNENPVSGRNC